MDLDAIWQVYLCYVALPDPEGKGGEIWGDKPTTQNMQLQMMLPSGE